MSQYFYYRSKYISKEENVYLRLYMYTLNVYFCKQDKNKSECLKRKSANSHNNIIYIPKSISFSCRLPAYLLTLYTYLTSP